MGMELALYYVYMSRQRLENKNIRKLSRIGRGKTYSITLPVDGIRQFNWQKKQKVVVEIDAKRKRFIIKDWPVRRSNKSLLESEGGQKK